MRVLAFAASVRKDSLNGKLIRVATDIAREFAEVDLAEFREFDMPLYDGDLNAARGCPRARRSWRGGWTRPTRILISTPEYNYSIPGTLKNAIDWVSRCRPMPWRGKSIYLMSASPSAVGGIRGLWQTRIPLEGCGALVFPDMYSLAHANDAFDESGRLKDPKRQEKLRTELIGFLRLLESYGGMWTDPVRRQDIDRALEDQTCDLQP